MYVDLQNKVKLNACKIKTKRELVNLLQCRNLPSSGTTAELRIRLQKHLKEVAKQHKCTSDDQLLLDKCILPFATCSGTGSETLYCFDDSENNLCKINLGFDGVGILGEVIELCKLNNVQGVRDMVLSSDKSSLICTTYGGKNGIMVINKETGV